MDLSSLIVILLAAVSNLHTTKCESENAKNKINETSRVFPAPPPFLPPLLYPVSSNKISKFDLWWNN